MAEYTPHAPEIFARLSPGEQEKWSAMLAGWKDTVRSLCLGREEKPTTLQQVVKCLSTSEFGSREWIALEDALLAEKHSMWTTKAIARSLKREPRDVMLRIGVLRRQGVLK